MNEHSAQPVGPTEGRLVPAATNLPAGYNPYHGAGAYPSAPMDDERDLMVDVLEYARILNKRKWLIAGVLFSSVALALVWTLMATPLYTAVVRLQIDRSASTVVEGAQTASKEDIQSMDFLKTQYELLKSRAISERVVSRLKLQNDPDYVPSAEEVGLTEKKTAAAKDGQSAAERTRDAVERLMKNIDVRPVPGSRLVDVNYTDPNPDRSQRVVNAYADAYIAANIDKRFEANAYAKTFLDDQIKQLKLRLESSEKTLLDFAEQEQIVTVTEKSSIAETNLSAANAALGNLVSERIKAEQLWRQVADVTGINLPQFLTNSVIETLRGKRKEYSTEYEEKLETFKPSYPAMVQISNKIKEIDRQIAAEVSTIKNSLQAGYESALAQENEMKKQIDTLRTEVLDLQKRSVQYNILKREVDTNRELYNGLLQRFKEVDVAGGVVANNIFIVDKAQTPERPSSPRLGRALLLAFALGLGGGIAVAIGLEKLDDKVLTAEDVEKATGLATLGVIPKLQLERGVIEELSDPRSALSEAYRSLATALQFSTNSGLPKTLSITSSGPSEGKSTTSVAIARHFANLGLKVLLIDADMRNPSLHKVLGYENSIGLSTYLTGSCAPPQAFQATDIKTLAFMSSGPIPPNPADLLASARLTSLLKNGLEIFDLIMVDGPPVLGLADAAILSNSVSATVFVVAAGQTRLGGLRLSFKRMQQGRAQLIGTILTKFDAKSAGYGYGYGYGYGAYTYGQSVGSDDRPAVTHSRST